MQRPSSVTAIFALSALLVVLGWTFFTLGSIFKPESELLPGVLRTASAYTVIAVPVFLGLVKKNVLLLRVGLALNIAASLPFKAAIGIVLSAISLGLTFKASAKEWFGA